MRPDMLSYLSICLLVVVLLGCFPNVKATDRITNESAAAEWYREYEAEAKKLYWQHGQIAWEYATNLTDYNKNRSMVADMEGTKYVKEVAKNASRFAWETFTNQTLKRIFKLLTRVGVSAMKDEDKVKRRIQLSADMRQIYSTAKVTIDGKELELDTGLREIMTKSRDYDTLIKAWKGWRDAVGKKIKPLYTEFVTLNNEGIRDAGHEDTGTFWRGTYEEVSFRHNMAALYRQLAPFYKEIHAYIRNKLKAVYGAEKFPKSGHIPAHLLGNMWAQKWMEIFPIVKPYDREAADVTQAMRDQNYTALRMFDVAEKFFISIGLPAMPESFWNLSMLVKPDDGRPVICHGSAWDFLSNNDVRIKMCTSVTTEDLITVHHEMGHIEYDLLYSEQPIVFREGANPGFHEAIGDVIKLSVLTPKHLHKINLLETVVDDAESDINFLLRAAIDEIVFLPFGYLMDIWRWGVFSGDVTEYEYNRRWWEHRCHYQGVSAPVQRTEDDFDPGAKFHIPNNTPYVRYYVATILKFQFHKALCAAANHTGPLHTCDIYNSSEAGALLRGMMSLGSSQPWPKVLEMITGHPEMNADALIEYFQPLRDWLKEYNAETNEEPGWENDCPNMEVIPPRVVVQQQACDSSPVMTFSMSITLLLSLMAIFCTIECHHDT